MCQATRLMSSVACWLLFHVAALELRTSKDILNHVREKLGAVKLCEPYNVRVSRAVSATIPITWRSFDVIVHMVAFLVCSCCQEGSVHSEVA